MNAFTFCVTAKFSFFFLSFFLSKNLLSARGFFTSSESGQLKELRRVAVENRFPFVVISDNDKYMQLLCKEVEKRNANSFYQAIVDFIYPDENRKFHLKNFHNLHVFSVLDTQVMPFNLHDRYPLIRERGKLACYMNTFRAAKNVITRLQLLQFNVNQPFSAGRVSYKESTSVFYVKHKEGSYNTNRFVQQIEDESLLNFVDVTNLNNPDNFLRSFIEQLQLPYLIILVNPGDSMKKFWKKWAILELPEKPAPASDVLVLRRLEVVEAPASTFNITPIQFSQIIVMFIIFSIVGIGVICLLGTSSPQLFDDKGLQVNKLH